MTYEDALNIYTDGSSFQSPRRGGIGIRFINYGNDGNEIVQDIQFSGYKNATNNQMELQACIMALEEGMRQHLHYDVSRVVIFTDSLYIIENYKKAIFEWPKNKWSRSCGQPVLNADQWKQLVRLIKKIGLRTDFIWVKGHAKDVNNRAVDKMAKLSSRLPLNKPLSNVYARRKESPETVNLGCVEVKGQRISIRIITTEYLVIQKINKYKYEVISKSNNFYGNIDILFTHQSLRAGHSYYVILNKDPKNPSIVKVIRELKRL